jgi:hypothetical protein
MTGRLPTVVPGSSNAGSPTAGRSSTVDAVEAGA